MKWLKANWMTLVILGVAIYLIVLGLMDDNYQMVLRKAIRICDECIGLGK